MEPIVIENIRSINPDEPDDFLILSLSWEDRCLGVAQRTKFYNSKFILINVYDNKTKKKEENLKELHRLLKSKGTLKNISSKQSRPIDGIIQMLNFIKNNSSNANPRISFDISCFTRKHLLQLLNCLECNNLLRNTNFYYSQPTNYFIEHNSTNAEGINSISEIETFSGENLSSRDTKLILFLNFEGRRATALWQELQPHITIPILPYPSVKKEWDIIVQNQNKLLLSTLNIRWEDIKKVNPLNTDDTKNLLIELTRNQENYNFIIAPLGTKPQVLGIFKFWRLFQNEISIQYPSPIHYKDIPNTIFPTEKTWFIDKSSEWEVVDI